VGDGGELDDYFWRVRVDVDRALGDMAGSEVALNAAAPGADKGEIQHSANYGAREGDEAAHPFFGGFLAEFYGKTFGNARSQFFDHLFFGEVLAEIDSGGGSGGEPEFAAFVGAGRFKSIEKTEPLDQTQGDDGKKARVGHERDHAAEAEARAFSESEALRIADHN